MKYEHTLISGDQYSAKEELKLLKEMSDEGWELVAVVSNTLNNAMRLYFKREVEKIEEKQVL